MALDVLALLELLERQLPYIAESKRMPRQHFKALLVLLAVVLSAALLGPVEYFVKPVSAASFNVTISNFAFVPRNMTVQGGDTVTWINNDPVVHTLWFTRVSDSSTYLFSDPINPTASWAHTFLDGVQLRYFDFDRLWVNGTLGVNGTVGGVLVPVNRPAPLAPYVGLAELVLAATVLTVVFLKRIKGQEANDS